ncbi:hypothetical protein SprV_0100157000 [Sparganum proliferum]
MAITGATEINSAHKGAIITQYKGKIYARLVRIYSPTSLRNRSKPSYVERTSQENALHRRQHSRTVGG